MHALMEYFIVLQKILSSENLTMGDFVIKGCHTQNSNGPYQLKLPSSREYKIVNYDLQDSHKLIKQAVMSRKEINHKRGHALSSRKMGLGKLLFFEDFPKMTVFGEMINWGKPFG